MMTEQELREGFRTYCYHKKLEFIAAVPIGKSVMLLAKGNKVIKRMKQYLNEQGLEYTEPSLMLEAIGTYVTLG